MFCFDFLTWILTWTGRWMVTWITILREMFLDCDWIIPVQLYQNNCAKFCYTWKQKNWYCKLIKLIFSWILLISNSMIPREISGGKHAISSHQRLDVITPRARCHHTLSLDVITPSARRHYRLSYMSSHLEIDVITPWVRCHHTLS